MCPDDSASGNCVRKEEGKEKSNSLPQMTNKIATKFC